MDSRIGNAGVLHLDEGDGCATVLRVGDAKFKEVRIAHPLVDGSAVLLGPPVHFLHRSDFPLDPQKPEGCFREGEGGECIDDAAHHAVLGRIIDGAKLHGALARQGHFGIDWGCELELARDSPGGLLLVLFDQRQSLRGERNQEVTGNPANCLLERHEQATLGHDLLNHILAPRHGAQHGGGVQHGMVFGGVAVDPVEKVQDFGAGISGGTRRFVTDAEEHLDAHAFQHVGRRDRALTLGEM